MGTDVATDVPFDYTAQPDPPRPRSAEPRPGPVPGPASGAASGAGAEPDAAPTAAPTAGPTAARTAGPSTGPAAGTSAGRPTAGSGVRPDAAAPYDHAVAEACARGVHAGPTSWAQARERAARAGAAPLAPVRLPLAEALGGHLALPLQALTDLPAFDTSAMDGWAVSGPGPWRIVASGQILAGQLPGAVLPDGSAVRIATGARLPTGATAVLRSEDGGVRRDRNGAELLHDQGRFPLDQGRDIRPRGQECRSGEPLLPAGTAVTPGVLGLAAAAGCDLLTVHGRPSVELLILGDELLDAGPPRDGRIRDALGPLLPSWLGAYGARMIGVRRVGDDLGLLRDALLRSPADVVVSTGGTAAGPVDFLHLALTEIGATLLVDGVRVRPGHPMLLASLPPLSAPGPEARPRHLVGLPGNPLAAVVGALTLAEPLLRGLGGCPPGPPYLVEAAVDLPGHREDVRLLPVLLPARGVLPLAFDGPAMLRGLALAEGFAVVPPGGVPAGARVEVLEVPTG